MTTLAARVGWIAAGWGAVLLLSLGCAEAEDQDAPFVMQSATENPRWTIDINRVLDGVYRNYRPRCIDTVRSGHTVEFRNFAPDLPANVTSISTPQDSGSLYSPNLVVPYNYVGRDDPDNQVCEILAEDGSCEQRAHFSYWRHTFVVPGVYDWIDTNSTEPGRKVVDAYYGTVTFVGIDPNTPFGTVCVPDDDDEGCQGICCSNDDDCESGHRCFRSEVDAVGRCLTPTG